MVGGMINATVGVGISMQGVAHTTQVRHDPARAASRSLFLVDGGKDKTLHTSDRSDHDLDHLVPRLPL